MHRRTIGKVEPVESCDTLTTDADFCASGTVPLRQSAMSHRPIRRILRARRARRRFMNGDLFADPAWDILLELFALRLEQRRITVTRLCRIPGTPATTVLRWVAKLEAENLIVRTPDTHDRRRSFVELSRDGERAMRCYMESLPSGLFHTEHSRV